MKKIAVIWNKETECKFEIANGILRSEKQTNPCRLELTVDPENLSPGSDPTIITVHDVTMSRCYDVTSFSFFLRDVTKKYPIFVPSAGVIISESGDKRSYKVIERAIRSRRLRSAGNQLESAQEESFEEASQNTRVLTCPTWLGLSRDFRIFEIGFHHGTEMWDYVMPRFHWPAVALSETGNNQVRYNFMLGRGFGCTQNVKRNIEDGALPILHGTVDEEDVVYDFTGFVTLEKSELTLKNLRGTHFLVADGYAVGHMLTPEQQKEFESLAPAEINREEETVYFYRAEAKNNAKVPRYAWFKNISPSQGAYSLDGATGFARFDSGRVFCVSRVNGKPLPQEEIAVLVQPGSSAVFEFILPHQPISESRARELANQDFNKRHEECRKFWLSKLSSAAGVLFPSFIRRGEGRLLNNPPHSSLKREEVVGLAAQLNLPEKRINEMVRAGLLHLDIITYGLEPDGTTAPTIGVYSPIGSESSPIIQFFDSMGWHDLARRSVMYFMDKQHEDGFIQNFGGYMLETGAALWNVGEHFRYTRDIEWLKSIEPKIIKSCDYIIKWIERNKREELKGRGYGMIDGKVADPEDPFHAFMLNGYAYLGLSRSAEIFSALSSPSLEKRGEGRFNDIANSLRQAALELKNNIRDSFFEAVARSPVVPLSDGTWCQTVAPWAEQNRGPLSLFSEKGKWFTHGSVVARDSLIGPLYLVFQEVIDPKEPAAEWMMNFHAELMCLRNVALSQPYYSRHPWVHLKRGEVNAFLKTYYNCVSGLADRETYSFWEHFFHASPHKTHEEGWFLMETRWMLYMEEGDSLNLLTAVPRKWLENNKTIELKNAASYFGHFSLKVRSELSKKRITAKIEFHSDRIPGSIEVRLPHPKGKKPRKVLGGVYDPATETVRIDPFPGKSEVVLIFT